MELITAMAPLLFVALAYVWYQRRKRAAFEATWVNGAHPNTQHCMTCGEDSPDAEGALRGDTWIGLLLWVCLRWPIAIAIVYTVGRRIGKGGKGATQCAPIAGALRWCPSRHPSRGRTAGTGVSESSRRP